MGKKIVDDALAYLARHPPVDVESLNIPEYKAPEIEQLPVHESVNRPSGPMPQVINKYLENIMRNVGNETSGQTEVGKALRAKADAKPAEGGE